MLGSWHSMRARVEQADGLECAVSAVSAVEDAAATGDIPYHVLLQPGIVILRVGLSHRCGENTVRCQCARGFLHAVRAQQRDDLKKGPYRQRDISDEPLCLL